jgi:hypothetical protein
MFERPRFDPHVLRQTYHCHVYDSERALYVEGHGVGGVHLDSGRLQVDDLPILRPRLTGDGISWAQQTSGRFSSGQLSFDKGGTELHGTVYAGSSSQDAVELPLVATTITPVPWATSITKQRQPAGTDPGSLSPDAWQDGLVLEIGYTQQLGGLVPQPVVCLDGQDISVATSWSIDRHTQQTVLLLNLDPDVYCVFDPSLYLNGTIAFDQLAPVPTFSGALTSICADQQGSGSYLWTGKPAVGSDADRPVAFGAPAPIALTAADLEDQPLSIAELMTIVPDSSVGDTANAMLVENMKWAFSQSSDESDWTSKYFGELPPVLSPDRQQLVLQNVDFYQQSFGKSYLGYAFSNYSGPNAPSVNLNDDEKLKLKYYLQTGMAKEPAFTTQQSGIYLEAFVTAKPRLALYAADGENWAQQLYAAITSPAALSLMVNRVWGAAGMPGTMTPANNFATLLSALEGTAGTLAGQYMQALMSSVLSDSARQTSFIDKDTVMSWLPDFLQQFLTEVAQSQTVPDEAKLLAQQIEELQAQLGGDLTMVASQLADFVINANGSNILQKTLNAESALLQAYPKLGALANGLFFIAWCGGVFMAIKAFQNWKALSPEDKAKAILSVVQLGLSAAEAVPGIITGLKQMGIDGWNKFQAWRNGPDALDWVESVNDFGEPLNDDWIKNGASETEELFDATGKVIKTEGTFWESVFENAGKIVAVVGIAVSAAFAVLSTIDFVNDIRHGASPTKEALDGIMAAANIVMTVCMVIDVFVATTVFAMAAAVLGIIGLVVGIIAMFLVKPKNPLDDFMSDTIIPFVDGLPPQTAPPVPGGGQFAVALA